MSNDLGTFQILMRSCRNERIEKRLWPRADRADATTGAYAAPAAATSTQAATTATRIVAEAMNEQRKNVDWTAAFALAARSGPRELAHALRMAMAHEYTTATEKFDALLARQRAECDAALAAQRATCDEILCAQQAEFEQHYAALRDELLAKIDNELAPVITALRQELAAANAELVRLRAAQHEA